MIAAEYAFDFHRMALHRLAASSLAANSAGER